MSVFFKNKYYRWYFAIISKAKERIYIPGYYERHHILPKCMGGTNHTFNLVKLTYKEHYIVHLLLTRMTEGKHRKSMFFALKSMTRPTGARKINSRWFERSKRIMAELGIAEKSPEHLAKIAAANRGRKASDEARANMSAAHKGKSPGNKGKKASEETRAKLSVARRKRITTDETRAKMSATRKGKKKSAEHAAKVAAALRGKTWKWSDEAKEKVSGRRLSEEHRAKIAEGVRIACSQRKMNELR